MCRRTIWGLLFNYLLLWFYVHNVSLQNFSFQKTCRTFSKMSTLLLLVIFCNHVRLRSNSGMESNSVCWLSPPGMPSLRSETPQSAKGYTISHSSGPVEKFLQTLTTKWPHLTGWLGPIWPGWLTRVFWHWRIHPGQLINLMTSHASPDLSPSLTYIMVITQFYIPRSPGWQKTNSLPLRSMDPIFLNLGRCIRAIWLVW